jgi:putative heme transporter
VVSAAPVATGPDGAGPRRSPTRSAGLRRAWLVIRILVVAGLAYFGALVVAANSAELSGAAGYLRRASWAWTAAAVLAEVLSYASFTQLQRVLLASGGLKTRLLPIAALTLAGNAINTTIPGGGAFATIFAYRQFRRRGADETLTTWTLVAYVSLAAITLALLAVVGLLVAGGDGPVGGLWPLIAGLIAGPVLAVVVLLRPRTLLAAGRPPLRWLRKATGRPRAAPEAILGRLVERLLAVTPSLKDWVTGLGWAMGNWLADCSCLVLATQAVGAPIPWRGVLVAYGAAQVAANLPITPGGLGVVEGSLTVALVAYGGSTAGSVAAVLLYRIISFWLLLPIGWTAFLGLQVEARRHPSEPPGIIAAVEADVAAP